MKNQFRPLDAYEEDLMKAIDKDELIELPNQSAEIKKYMSYVRDMPRKDTRITIRVHEEDLIYIQNQAIETGIPYQTLISALLHQYAKGKIVLSA